jgi:hypothetical protein
MYVWEGKGPGSKAADRVLGVLRDAERWGGGRVRRKAEGLQEEKEGIRGWRKGWE